jgi:peroxiredoxin
MLSRCSFVLSGWSILFLLVFSLIFATPTMALEIGAEPPGFELKNLSGDSVALTDFRGQAIILKLATTWCFDCQRQMQELAKVETFLTDNNIAVLEVFVAGEPESDVRAYLQGRKYNGPSVVLIDEGEVARDYGVIGVPWVLLIDKKFRIQRIGSLMTATDLQGQLKTLVGK